ncbi:MAG: DUF4328 domain-containing protein [Chitinophagales bacterium]|nr:DUF4328 domain-containing protein [Chitinophagales bacterium]
MKKFLDTSAEMQLTKWANTVVIIVFLSYFLVNLAAFLSVRHGKQAWDYASYATPLFWLCLATYAFSVMILTRWVYYCYKNISMIGKLQHGVKWAVAYFYIPALNLVYPGRVLEEIWYRLQIMNGVKPKGNSYINLWSYSYFISLFLILIMVIVNSPNYKVGLTRNMVCSGLIILSTWSLNKALKQLAFQEKKGYRNYNINFPEGDD